MTESNNCEYLAIKKCSALSQTKLQLKVENLLEKRNTAGGNTLN